MKRGWCLFCFLLLVSCGTAVSRAETPSSTLSPIPGNTNDAVSLSDGTVDFSYWNHTVNADGSVADYRSGTRTIDSTNFNIKIIENGLVRVKLLPEYGGRILSIVYKPSGREELYQNPVGSPYGYQEGNFYYNWLMVYGGIFPTFPEPEHGKTWQLPWSYQVITDSDDQVTVQMSITDNMEYSGRPGRFDNGITGLICTTRVTIYRGRSVVEMSMTLSNPAAVQKTYEYWTCTTLTPGSVPGNTYSPGNSLMAVPISQYQAGWSEGDWISKKGSDYSTIDTFSEWDNMGIAYAVNLTNRHWGVINEDNLEGIFRIADNATKTPGLKFWTWGYSQSVNVNPSNSTYAADGSRPYIELWAGHSTRFLPIKPWPRILPWFGLRPISRRWGCPTLFPPANTARSISILPCPAEP